MLEAQQPGGTRGILQSTETPCEQQMDLPFQALRTRDSTKLRALLVTAALWGHRSDTDSGAKLHK